MVVIMMVVVIVAMAVVVAIVVAVGTMLTGGLPSLPLLPRQGQGIMVAFVHSARSFDAHPHRGEGIYATRLLSSL